MKGIALVNIPLKLKICRFVFINIDPASKGSNDEKMTDDVKLVDGVIQSDAKEELHSDLHDEHIYSKLNNMLELSEAKFEERMLKLEEQITEKNEAEFEKRLLNFEKRIVKNKAQFEERILKLEEQITEKNQAQFENHMPKLHESSQKQITESQDKI